MARRGLRIEEADEEELNLTPMLDVVFILLIFFIVTAVFVKEPGVDPVRPDVAGEDQKPVIIVAVTSDNEVWIDGGQVDIREIKPAIEALKSENPKGEAIIQGDDLADYGIVYQVMTTLTEAGVPAQYVSTMRQ